MQHAHINLDALNPEDSLAADVVAAALDKHASTLSRWRRERKYLPFTQVGREARYRAGDVVEFLKAARIEPEIRGRP